MSNHRSQKSINLHHKQVDNARLKKLKAQYEREHRYNAQRARGLRVKLAIDIFKAVYISFFVIGLATAIIYCLSELF